MFQCLWARVAKPLVLEVSYGFIWLFLGVSVEFISLCGEKRCVRGGWQVFQDVLVVSIR